MNPQILWHPQHPHFLRRWVGPRHMVLAGNNLWFFKMKTNILSNHCFSNISNDLTFELEVWGPHNLQYKRLDWKNSSINQWKARFEWCSFRYFHYSRFGVFLFKNHMHVKTVWMGCFAIKTIISNHKSEKMWKLTEHFPDFTCWKWDFLDIFCPVLTLHQVALENLVWAHGPEPT